MDDKRNESGDEGAKMMMKTQRDEIGDEKCKRDEIDDEEVEMMMKNIKGTRWIMREQKW
jgi:hypothetical protein